MIKLKMIKFANYSYIYIMLINIFASNDMLINFFDLNSNYIWPGLIVKFIKWIDIVYSLSFPNVDKTIM